MKDKDEIVRELKNIVGKKWTITEKEFMENYLRDETPEPVRPRPNNDVILVKPASTDEVSRILRFANEKRIPVFPVGGRTGLVGGAVPTEPGIILSLERMNKIKIDRENMMAITEAGATLGDLIKATEEADLFFPPHPGDEGAQIGGLIATNAGGVRAVKYGIMRNYVKGIEAVLPSGEVLSLGGMLLKNNEGYDLMQLIIGSEGTLAVITKGVIKLYPKEGSYVTLIVPFNRRYDALNVVPKISQSSIMPLAIEYIERKEIEKAAEHLNEKWPVQEGEFQLLIMISGINEEELLSRCEELSTICQENNASETRLADTKDEQDRILKVRSNIYTYLKNQLFDILDVTVPPSRLGELMSRVDDIAKKYDAYVPVYGHAGDGNLHIHLMKEGGKKPKYMEEMKREIYKAGVELGGVITGEHGIGKIRIKDVKISLSRKEMELMRSIKHIFDPNNILNPRELGI